MKPGVLARKQRIAKLLSRGELGEARAQCRKLCKQAPKDIDGWFLLGAVSGSLGDYDAATECCRKVIRLSPGHVQAHYNLAIALRDSGHPEGALKVLSKLRKLDPSHRDTRSTLGNLLISMGRYSDAEEVFLDALKEHPDDPEFFACLASAMQTKGQLGAASSWYRKALDLDIKNRPGVLDNLASVYCGQGKFEESLKFYREALAESPSDPRIYSNLLLTSHYSEQVDPVGLYEMHRRWPGNHSGSSIRFDHSRRDRDPDRKLRIGYVSSDFREHSVAYFIEPVMSAHKRSAFEVYCYHNSLKSDRITERLQAVTDGWCVCEKLDDATLARRIYEDEIDILVDLNGHTAGGRLPVFCMRPAPVQVTYLGYPNTTGANGVDYRLTDACADPEGEDQFYSEKLLRLPSFLCYQPPDECPPVSSSPAEKNGFVTFGSFNNLAKLNKGVVDQWCRILHLVAGARLLLKNPSFTDNATVEYYRALFDERGIEEERVELIGFTKTTAEHLEMYSRIDIALDTYPYNGTTTTCEALWMGVPVISQCGDVHRARVGKSLLTLINAEDWLSDTSEEYIERAVRLAGDIPGLVELRRTMRARLENSALMDADGFVAGLELAYREMWVDYVSDRR